MQTRLTQPLKWHGGKFFLASQIVSLMPAHTHYCEAFAGGLAVLFAKPFEGVSEVINDLNGDLTGFWRVLQNDDTFARFIHIVQAVPFSRPEWEKASNHVRGEDAVADAAAFFIQCRQSMAGRMESFAPLSRTRTRRGLNEQASAWLTAVEGLTAVHARLKRVVVENDNALAVIKREDGPGTLHYLDPPYLDSTRTSPNVYAHEMSVADHKDMLDVLRGCRGKCMLSGYDSDLYRQALHD